MKHAQLTLLAAIIGLNLTGCVVHQTTKTDSHATATNEVESFIPEVSRKGSIPPVDADIQKVKSVAIGMSKDTVYSLIGRQHYREGFNREVNDWDYLFNFKNPHGKGMITCEFEVLFNDKNEVKSTYWRPESCPALVAGFDQFKKPAENLPQSEPQPVLVETERLTLSADGLFEFDQYSISSLRPGAKEKLDHLISKIKNFGELVSLKITGHTDRLGTEFYNLKLSESRANTIKQYLVNAGFSEALIKTESAGEAMPVVECRETKRSKALINCLEPNRRFEIEADVTKKNK